MPIKLFQKIAEEETPEIILEDQHHLIPKLDKDITQKRNRSQVYLMSIYAKSLTKRAIKPN